MKLLPYPEYKDSGVPWLGKIPKHWEIRRLKYLASINSRVLPESTDKNYKFKYLDISSVGTGLLIAEPQALYFGQAPSRARRILQKGDTILSTVRTYLKAIYYIANDIEDWIASTGFATLTPQKEMFPPFLGAAVQSDNFIDQVIRESIGIAYPAIGEAKLGALYLTYPVSTDEQRAISCFLKDKTAQINKFIRNKRRLIALLKEQKQNIINQAVTGKCEVRRVKGENGEERLEAFPTSPLKLRPSNVEWLGDIPEHWEVRRLKTISMIIMGQSPASDDCNIENDGLPFLQGCFEFKDIHPLPIQYCKVPKKVAPMNSILMSVRAPVGSLNLADQVYCIGRGLCSIVPWLDTVDTVYLLHSISTCKNQLSIMSTGSTYDAVSIGDVGDLRVTLPPLNEQQTIIAYIEVESSKIDQAITRAEREIELMREYRTRLISDVVTGQIDVRGIEVPEVGEDELLALEEDTADADDVIDDEGDMDEND